MSIKKSMYEVLGVPQTATLEQIKAAHRRLSLDLMSHAQGKEWGEIDAQLKILDVALHTLSNPATRDAYDAELAPSSGLMLAPYEPPKTGTLGEAAALSMVPDIVKAYQPAQVPVRLAPTALEVSTSTVKASVRSLKLILRTIIGLSVLGVVISVGRGAVAMRTGGMQTPEMRRAEEKLIILEYYKKYGERPASRAEAELLEKENVRKANEVRSVEFREKRSQEEYQRFVDSSRRDGERISSDVERQEAWERQRIEQEERLAREREEQKKAMEEEQERRRIEQELARYRAINRGGSGYSDGYNSGYNEGYNRGCGEC